MSDQSPKVRFTGSVDLSSVDAMFATTLAKLAELSNKIDDRVHVLGQKMEGRFDSQDVTIEAIVVQTTKTNGRVGKVEERATALENYKSSLRNRAIGFIAAGSLVGGLIGWAIESGLRLSFR